MHFFKRRNVRRLLLRVGLVIVAALLFGLAAFIGIQNIMGNIKGAWTTILTLVFAIIAVYVSLLQWLLPTSLRSISSDILLVDASLDPDDSHYEQITENGRTVIQHNPRISKFGSDCRTFPAIDFRFRNQGTVAATFLRYEVSVLKVEIDTTPLLEDFWWVDEGILKIGIFNYGWGPALNCQLQVDQELLNRLFPSSSRQYNGTIESGAEHVFSFSKDSIDPKVLSKNVNTGFLDRLTSVIFARINGAPKHVPSVKFEGPFNVKGTFQDDKHASHIHEEILTFSTFSLDLTKDGFVRLQVDLRGSGQHSDYTYITLIDPLKGPHTKSYHFARKVDPADAERFHILVGATMSCYLRIKFNFFIDEFSIESKEIDFKIWNPRNSRLGSFYRDGDKQKRDD